MPCVSSNPNYILEPFLINVPFQSFKAEELVRFLGTGGSRTRVWRAIEETSGRLQEMSAPDLLNVRACLSIVSIKEAGKREIELSGFVMLCNTCFFRGANWAALTIMTLGEEAEEEEARLFRSGKRLDAFILKALAAASMERGMQVIRKELRQKLAPTGMCLGYNISPGCQGIPLETQKIILELVHAEKIGVKINEYFIMRPTNSVSNIIPLGQHLMFESITGSTCQICNMGSRCSHRKHF